MLHAHGLAIVEDDPGLLRDLVEYLQLRGFAATGFGSAEAFLAAWPSTPFALLVLDVALPGASGLAIARTVRAHPGPESRAGIVMLTALDANEDHLLGLDAGADVYLSKRSTLDVIEATCRSLLRRLEPAPGARADAPDAGNGHWHLDTRRWRLRAPDGTRLELTHAEVVLLAALFEQAGLAVDRKELLQRLGRRETLHGMRNLDNTTSRLRRKVQAASGLELPVRPSYGQGYTFTGPCELQA